MKRKPWLLLGLVAVGVLLGAFVAGPVTAAPDREEMALLAAEDARFAAQVGKDVASVAAALADELAYTHAIGRVQTKSQYLDQLAAGKIDYRSITPSGRSVRVSGDLGVTHATLETVVGDHTLRSSYLAAYVRRGGRWQLLYWQTTPEYVPPPASSGPAN